MDKKIALGVVALFIVSVIVLLAAPEDAPDTPATLPWNITHPTPDTVRVFGITLGVSTLSDANKVFKEESDVSLFKPSDAGMGVEAFIEEVNFNGLKAKIVMTVAVDPEKLQGMYERGLRINSTPSGKRITLTADDLLIVRNSPVASLTYLPNVSLDEAIVSKRFGEPAMRIKETRSGAVHWLYPQHGLDVVLGGKERPLLQYVALKNFEQIRAPLLKNGEEIKN
jgi:hypothetical protein